MKADKIQQRINLATRTLAAKNDCRFHNNTIYVLNGKDPKNPRKNDLGLKSWGHIDFLVKCGMSVQYVYNWKL